MVINDVRNKQAVGYVSALTPPILYFFRRRTRGEKAARQTVQRILRDFTVVPLTGEAIETAYATLLPDFEDALQFEAAKTATVEVLVTRNKRHFRQQEIQVLTPEDLLHVGKLRKGRSWRIESGQAPVSDASNKVRASVTQHIVRHQRKIESLFRNFSENPQCNCGFSSNSYDPKLCHISVFLASVRFSPIVRCFFLICARQGK